MAATMQCGGSWRVVGAAIANLANKDPFSHHALSGVSSLTLQQCVSSVAQFMTCMHQDI